MSEEPTVEAAWTEDGIECAVLRHPYFGHLCGYARIPKGHPWYCKESDEPASGAAQPRVQLREKIERLEEPDDDGLAALTRNMTKSSLGERMVPDDDHPDHVSYERTIEGVVEVHGGITFAGDDLVGLGPGWWIGFDCHHAWDGVAPDHMSPAMREVRLRLGHPLVDGHVWSVDEVKEECKKMVAAIKAHANHESLR